MSAKILIVEDEAIVALDLQRRLISMGYQVPKIAASHDRALSAANEIDPDLVLMDINIAGRRDGIETAKQMVAPVIYLTAYSEEKTLERARATRPYGYLIKPFSERELHSTIQMALERNRYDRALYLHDQQLNEANQSLTEQKHELEQRAAELFNDKQYLELTLNSIFDGVITTDQHGTVTYLNPAAEHKTGWRLGDAFGQSISTVFRLQEADAGMAVPSSVEQVICSPAHQPSFSRCNLVSKGGEIFSVEDHTAPLYDYRSRLTGTVTVFHDVSEARRHADEMTYQATHDQLTGLFNRAEFDHRIQLAVNAAAQQGSQHALAYLDLDQFKIVNDTCGHSAGDELLRQVTGRLRVVLRSSDILARIGGDEFGILLESCPPRSALQIAENLRSIVEKFHFSWDDKLFPVGASIGLVNFGGSAAHDLSAKELLQLADNACYTAKDLGRNRVHVYHPAEEPLNQRLGNLPWYSQICSAISENRLTLYSQKIVALEKTGQYREHVELLLRLISRDGSTVPPMAFIPTAERYGLMPEIDRWMMQAAFRYIEARDHGARSLYCINLSGATLNHPDTLPFILDLLTNAGIHLESICFEITETAAITNLLNARSFILALRTKGCKFALDNFGGGVSSFAYLKHLPVNFLKIDGALTKELATSQSDCAVVEAINHIGHVMGLKTIAELVEDETDLTRLRAIGVDFAQGFGVGRPEPVFFGSMH